MRQKPSYPEDEAFHEALGRALKVLRAERGLERKDLAEMAGLSYPYVSEIESGKKRPSSRAVLALAEALGVPAHHLWEMADALQTQTAMSPAPEERVSRSYFHTEERAPSADAAQVAPMSIPPPSVAMPMSAKRPRLARRRAKAEPAVGAATPADPGSGEGGLLDELIAAASRLPAQDLEQLVVLARRLAR